jgi:alkyl sulfatase BDS1-like metallo-beta-lactamase superfamily hydrolase
MTIVESDSGLIVIVTLTAAESAKADSYQNPPRKPVVAIIYTHTHVDHFDGVKGVI